MNILVLENITKAYGERTLFDSVSLGINEGDKIGVIGVSSTRMLRFLLTYWKESWMEQTTGQPKVTPGQS